jgi:hypothetical protein
MQIITPIFEEIRILVLYFFVMNVGILLKKLRSMTYEELQLRLQKYKLKWKITISIFSVAAICVLTMIILRHQVN